MAEAVRDMSSARRTEDRERTQHQKVRSMFFVSTGMAGFGIALVCLALGTYIDTGKVPFRTWSLVCYLVGSVLVVGLSQTSAALYRKYRRRTRHSA